MFSSIRNRLLLIALVSAGALYNLWPRERIQRYFVDGQPVDSITKPWNIKLGLDLQGGMHMALEIDQSGGPVANPEDALDRATTVIRSRIDEFGVAEPQVQKQGTDRLIVELPGITDPARAKEIVERSAFLEFRITDMDGRFESAIAAIQSALARAGVRPRTQSTDVGLGSLLGGADSAAGAADSSQRSGDSTITDLSGKGIFDGYLYSTGLPGEYQVPVQDAAYVDTLIKMPEFQRAMPRGLELLWGRDTVSLAGVPYLPLYALAERPIITGEYISDAQANLDQTYNQPVVNFTLTRSGGRIFGRETAQHIGDYMAIALDRRVQGTPPVIRGQITRNGQIELGSSSVQDAQDLALVLRAGALPAPVHIVEERTVGPSLGRDSIAKGRIAGLVSIVLVIGIMMYYYRLTGVLAVSALAFYVLFALGGLSMLDATLTLPGLAGFVLSLGLAVDANVLIFERIREELALKKSPRLAVDLGFQSAMPAIIDANVTTVITAAFLFQFGTGPVKGFAVTLIIGILASLFTAIFVTRTFFMIWLQRRQATAELSI